MTRPSLDPEVLAFPTHRERCGAVLSRMLAEGIDHFDSREIDLIIDEIFSVPIPTVMFCPECGTQHIDEPEEERVEHLHHGDQHVEDVIVGWDNPPHKSHLCHHCKYVWRPSDVCTEGVLKLDKRGSRDSAVPPHELPQVQERWKLHNTTAVVIDTGEDVKKISLRENVKNAIDDLYTKVGTTGVPSYVSLAQERRRNREARAKEFERATFRNSVLLNLRNKVMEIRWLWGRSKVVNMIDEARQEIISFDEKVSR